MSKFANEQGLKVAVDNLENKVAMLNSTYQKEKKKLQNEVVRLKEEKSAAESATKELTAKNRALQDRNDELGKNIEDTFFSHSALSAEYEKLLNSSKRFEAKMLEAAQNERDNIAAVVEKQKKMFEAAMEEQQLLIEEASRKGSEITELIKLERNKQEESVGKIKDNYQKMRTNMSTQEVCMMQQNNSTSRRFNPSSGSLQRRTEIGHNCNGVQTGNKENQFSASNSRSHIDSSEFKNYCTIHDIEINESTMKATSKEPRESQPPGFLQFLEQKSHQQQKPIHSSPATSSSSQSRRTMPRPTMPQPVIPQTSIPQPTIPKPSSTKNNDNLQYSSTTNNFSQDSSVNNNDSQYSSANNSNSHYSGEIRHRPIPPSLSSNKKDLNSAVHSSQNNIISQTSFSLDEFSDYGSKHSSCNDSIGNDYAGMTSAIKKGMIRVNPRRPNEMGRGNNWKPSEYSDQNMTEGMSRRSSTKNSESHSMEAFRNRHLKQRNKYSVDEYGDDLFSMGSSNGSDDH